MLSYIYIFYCIYESFFCYICVKLCHDIFEIKNLSRILFIKGLFCFLQKLIKSKFVLSFLASSFVIATGLVGMSNVNSIYAMITKNSDSYSDNFFSGGFVDETNIDEDGCIKILDNYKLSVGDFNSLKERAYEEAFGKYFFRSGWNLEDIFVKVDDNRNLYYYYKYENFDGKPFNIHYHYISGPNGKAFKYEKVSEGDWQLRKQESKNGGDLITHGDNYEITRFKLNNFKKAFTKKPLENILWQAGTNVMILKLNYCQMEA